MSTICELEKQIRELAYQKWANAGCPATNEEERNRFWFEAEQEIINIKKSDKKLEKIEKLTIKSVSKKRK